MKPMWFRTEGLVEREGGNPDPKSMVGNFFGEAPVGRIEHVIQRKGYFMISTFQPMMLKNMHRLGCINPCK